MLRRSPDEVIASLGIANEIDIDQVLIQICENEANDEERDADVGLCFDCVDSVLARHRENPDPVVQKYVARALFRRAQLLDHLRKFDEADAEFDTFWSRYKDSDDPAVRKAITDGQQVRSNCLAAQGRYQEALEAFDRSGVSLDDIREDSDETLNILKLLINRFSILVDMGHIQEARDFSAEAERRVMAFKRRPKVEILATVFAMGAFIQARHPVSDSPDTE